MLHAARSGYYIMTSITLYLFHLVSISLDDGKRDRSQLTSS